MSFAFLTRRIVWIFYGTETGNGVFFFFFVMLSLIIEYLERPFPVLSRLCGWSYLIYFLTLINPAPVCAYMYDIKN